MGNSPNGVAVTGSTQSILIHPPIDATESGFSLSTREHTLKSQLSYFLQKKERIRPWAYYGTPDPGRFTLTLYVYPEPNPGWPARLRRRSENAGRLRNFS